MSKAQIKNPFNNMCYVLRVLSQYRCQHIILDHRQKVDCNSNTCSKSASHVPREHSCLTECTQRMGNTQDLIRPNPNFSCNACHLAGF
ncbi:hypothetical protein JR316_0008284 [Psilocybe cubensis]|uniref:Uncharacterized protein n=2 Tax=Psilocybe cubensis TaxID=181762 RepID=A0ACB8GXE8_PSICU|nr:hypothetical protein JR316_0008284 [Psilocybe cubensis]KAH9479689.1 hypothetical protein JR316_0008284 [Psilocybe cubensis]